MSKFYNDIMDGLNDVLDDLQGKKNLQRRTVCIVPPKDYTALEVKKIRKSVGMSQKMFAGYMGVSDKTVEAWESGRNTPSGAASRLLSILEKDNDIVEKYPFVQRV